MLKQIFRWIEKNEWLILLSLLALILRIPSLIEPYWYGDEGIYLVLGQAIRKGLVLYKDIHDNKPPLLYLLAALAGNVFYFRLILMVWFGATVTVFYRLMQVLFPKNNKAWGLSTLTMIILTTLAEGNVANAEIFMALPTTTAMLIAYQSVKSKPPKKGWKWLSVGVLLAAAFLLKVPAVFDLMALVVWLAIFEKNKVLEIIKSLKDKRIWLIVVGFLLPVAMSIGYYYQRGAGERYFRSALGQNIGYLASWNTGEHSASGFATESGLIKRAVVLLIGLSLFYPLARKYKLSSGAKLTVGWFMCAMFGALLSERPYPHYLIQPVIPLSILLSFFVFGSRKLLKAVVLTVMAVAGIYYYQIRFWYYPILPYYKNFITYISGKENKEEYRAYFDRRVNQTYQLAEYLKTTTNKDERTFIWGDEPYIYALANRLPVGRYAVAYHVIDFNGYEETLEDFDKYQPRVVMVMEYEEREFPGLLDRINTDYVLVDKMDRAIVYRRINGTK